MVAFERGLERIVQYLGLLGLLSVGILMTEMLEIMGTYSNSHMGTP